MPPMTRRRSSRLASASKAQQGGPAPQNLASLAEGDETPSEPQYPTLPTVDTRSPFSPSQRAPRTPASSSPNKPSPREMHPSKTQPAQAPPSSALRLGFADIQPARLSSASRQHNFDDDEVDPTPEETAAMLQATPSKVSTVPPSSAFTFRFTRQSNAGANDDLGLSDEARRMMEELREEASKIRADLEVQREQERAAAIEAGEMDVHGRRIAKPKTRSRYSAAHTAEFQKMDSIANHPSAFRAATGRSTPLKSSAATAPTPAAAGSVSSQARGLKRTQSKANLDDTPGSAARPKTAKPAIPSSASRSITKPRHNPLFGASSAIKAAKTAVSPHKANARYGDEPMSAAKRVKQNFADDTSSSRPMSRDGSFLPRPATANGKEPATNGIHGAGLAARSHTMASLMTPTKASLARSAGAGSPSSTASMLHKTPSKSCLKKAHTTNNLQSPAPALAPAPSTTAAAKSALPLPAGSATIAHISKTPAPARVMKPLPRFPVPATTPRRRMSKHVAFTPTPQRTVLAECSPSLFRSAIPRSTSKLNLAEATMEDANDVGPAVPAKDQSPSVRRFGATVAYPDLSRGLLSEQPNDDNVEEEEEEDVIHQSPSVKAANVSKPLPSVPGSFTFRSDKTINFGASSPGGFGSSPGQVSLRQVRQSIAPAAAPASGRPASSRGMIPRMPGSFPGSSIFSALVATDGPNKENAKPVPTGIPHGIGNKKRHRVSEADEQAEQEAADRAAKKRKSKPVAEGEALLAPRLTGAGKGTGSVRNTPQKTQNHVSFSASTTGKTPASAKKRPILSMSRLNSLARPKLRK